MKPARTLCSVLLLGAMPLAAQNGPQTQAAALAQAAVLAAVQSPCPITLRAEHLADGTMMEAGQAHPPGIGQSLRLAFTSPDARQIVRAQITVHGLTEKPRGMPVLSDSRQPPDATRTLAVRLTAPGKAATAEIWVPDMTAVQAVDLDSVTFTNGLSWRPAPGQSCRVKPDPLMLIQNR